ncbi:hypothetical protein V9L05_22240 (plasmid) [Bernardetia sp. Wsw4-3y2]|uniref:hypothetical protein n=1 Tax=Bernardetia sp. Wsw4-3y2 TaxID=3127471 RepID=UPI0030D0911C
MIANFYLFKDSFQYKEGLTTDDLEEKIKKFSVDYEYIREYENDNVFIQDSVYDAYIFPNITVVDLMYDIKYKQKFDRDTLEFLRLIVEKSADTDLSNEEIIDLLPTHSQEEIFGVLCFQEIENIEQKYLVYDKNDWLSFHRYFLALYPIDNLFFISECEKYFPALCFHSNNKLSIKSILDDFSIEIIRHLSELNDKFKTIRSEDTHLPNAIIVFSSTCNINVSLEGDASRRNDLTFDFETEDGKLEPVYCEPHTKINSHNNKGNTNYFQHRIYFHEGKNHIQKGNILIGHIGEHL